MLMDKGRIAVLAIAVGIVVFLLKLLAYAVSDSVALLSDAMESIINIVASIMMFVALMISARPEDADHRYGHQKAENISALIEGVLIIIAAVLIVEATIGRLFDPVALENVDLGLLISLAATSLNGLLAFMMLRVARASRSMALEGDAKHLFSDVMSSGGVVLGLFIASVTGLYVLDPLIALVVAALLVKMGIEVLRSTCHDLMDSACEEEERSIIEVLERNQGFLEYHDLKTRRSGNNIFLDVHVCLEGNTTVSAGQELITQLENDLRSAVPHLVPNIRLEDHTQCQKDKGRGAERPI
ncbi:MAG: cation diffusion facilitator family transporter [Methanomassiliicoccus sp.]|nr:cation diffusion facilitator family transporter [Methanomassiliicoccus sp.]